MGRDAGHIALSAGISGGADAILIPEISWSAGGLAEKIGRVRDNGRNFGLVIVAEAARLPDRGVGHQVGALIEDATGAETRVTVLGHVQRGGTPAPRDR